MMVRKLWKDDLDNAISQTAGLWDELRAGNIFLTGGTGFFGCWLVETFLHANCQYNLNATLHLLTRNPAAFLAKMPHLRNRSDLVLHHGDVRSFSLPTLRCSHVIHAAVADGTQPEFPKGISSLSGIIDGARSVLEFARRCDAKKLLFTSSGAVYGPQPSELLKIDESYTGAPNPMHGRSFYGEAKRASEVLCAMYAQTFGFEVKIARCFAFVGPHLPLNTNYAVGNFINNAIHGVPIAIDGDGTPYRSYLYASDLASWLWQILFLGKSCRPYNVGSDEPVTILDLAKCVRDLISRDSEIVIAKSPVPGSKPERYVPAIDRCRLELGLKVTVGLRDAIVRTAKWNCSDSTVI
jgi:dTDP-glucose 4,6-dehydratase